MDLQDLDIQPIELKNLFSLKKKGDETEEPTNEKIERLKKILQNARVNEQMLTKEMEEEIKQELQDEIRKAKEPEIV